MKRCPQCNRLDDALVFCRADGTGLIGDSTSFNSEAWVRLDATESETNVLAHDPPR